LVWQNLGLPQRRRRVYRITMGRHAGDKAPANDPLMTSVVSVLLLLAAGVCLLAVF